MSLGLALAMSPALPAGPLTYATTLLGANEVPPNASPATGSAILTLNGDLLTVNETFSGLLASASAAHIHCCALPGFNAGVAVPFPGFPNAASGTYSQTFDLTLSTTYNAAFVTANGGTTASAEAALIAGLNAGQTYLNIHDPVYPGGEIRGQLAAVPEPATLGLAGASLLILALLRRSGIT